MAPRIDPQQAAEAMLAAGVEPLAPYPGTGVPWPSRCLSCGREVSPRYTNIRAGHGGCRHCGAPAKDAATAAAAMQAAALEPLTPYPGANTPWRSRCTRCQREVSPTLHQVQRGKTACRFCAGQAVDPEQAADLMRAAGFEPLTPYERATAPWRCRCTRCGNEVSPSYNTVQQGGRCAFCVGNKVNPQQAAALMRRAGLEPLVPYPGSATPWRCRCASCGREVTPRYTNIKRGHGGCAHCARANR